MGTASDVDLAMRFYDARGDRSVIDEVMSQDVIWDITPGFPLGGVYRGLESVLRDFLAPLAGRLQSMRAQPEWYMADGLGHVAVLGSYAATSTDGHSEQIRFVHVWTVEKGKLVQLQQTADTQILARILEVD